MSSESAAILSLPPPPDMGQVHPIVVAQPLMLKGTYDGRSITHLQLMAEDGAPLPLTYSKGQWQLSVTPRWLTVGFHWLKMQGHDRQAKPIAEEYFYFHVQHGAAPVPLQLHILQDAWLKRTPQDSQQLSPAKKVRLTAGQILPIVRYGQMGSQLCLCLTEPIAPIGQYGYLDATAVALAAGAAIARFPLLATASQAVAAQQLQVKRTTFLKSHIADSTQLTPDQRQQLIQGQVFPLDRAARCGDYWQVSLPQTNLPDRAYVAAQDVQLWPAPAPIHCPNPIGISLPQDWPRLNLVTLAAAVQDLGRLPRSTDRVDALAQWCFAHGGLGAQVDQATLIALLAAHGMQVDWRDDWRWDDLAQRCTANQVVVVRSRLTPMQQLIRLRHRQPRGWLVDDPWGDATTGYVQMLGDRVCYPQDYFAEMVGGDGAISGAVMHG